MRINSIAMAAALFLAGHLAEPAQATTITAAGTLPLRITVVGKSVNRADSVVTILPIMTAGTTEAEARAARDKRVDALTKALIAAGIDPSGIRLLPPGIRMGFVGKELFSPEGEMDESSEAPIASKPLQHESAVLRIEFSDPNLVPRMNETLTNLGCDPIPIPRFALRNDGMAHKAAIADALATARREAEIYAETLGMQVSRMVKISNAGEMGPTGIDTIEQMTVYRILSGMDDGDPASISTTVRVWVDFELAPR